MDLVSLNTERLVLAPLDPIADAPDLFDRDRDPRVHEFVYGASVSASVEQTRAQLTSELADNGGATWSIRRHGEARVLGTAGLFGDQGTAIRGLGWSLHPRFWSQGIMSEAAVVVVAHLLAQPGVDGLEAWVDACNVGSLIVARRAGLWERARLPRSYTDRIGQTVVMAIAAKPVDPAVYAATAVLEVRDVAASAALLGDVLGLEIAWLAGEPPAVAQLALAPWSGAAGVRLRRGEGPITAAVVTFEVGVWVDDLADAARGAGLEVVAEPEDRPWGRRDFAFVLPDGHRIEVSGATTPGR